MNEVVNDPVRWRDGLSAQQLAVVDWIEKDTGSLTLTARAGCGKTYAMIHGAVRAIVEGGFGDIALMAYNKSAANEFKERLGRLAKSTGNREFVNSRLVNAGTVHSFGFGALKRYEPSVRVDDRKVLNICKSMSRSKDSFVWRERRPITRLVSLAKQSAIGFLTRLDNYDAWRYLVDRHAIVDSDEEDKVHNDTLIDYAMAVLRQSIELDRTVIDFDDMILGPLIHKVSLRKRDWVLIDEAQDTNAARRCLALRMIKPETGRLIAVGDDRQAIYGFTGADSDSMQLIANEVNAKNLPLTVTYRCPKLVVKEANRIVPDLVAHPSAPTGSVSSMPISATVGEKGPLKSWFETLDFSGEDAVLCRNTKPLVETAYQMLASGIGCRVEGRDIGEGLIALATKWKRITSLFDLIEKLHGYREREVDKWLTQGLEDRAQAVEDKVESLVVISSELIKTGKTKVDDLVDWINSLFSDTREGEKPSVVTLSTVHKAKGREWNRVFVLKRNETMPSKYAKSEWQLHQEKNIEYVAITRAKSDLIFVD